MVSHVSNENFILCIAGGWLKIKSTLVLKVFFCKRKSWFQKSGRFFPEMDESQKSLIFVGTFEVGPWLSPIRLPLNPSLMHCASVLS